MTLRRRRHAARQGVRGCQGKRRYADKRYARAAITRMRTYTPAPDNAHLGVYWCAVCEAWHVGHSSKDW